MTNIKEKIESKIKEALGLDFEIVIEKAKFGEADFTLPPKSLNEISEKISIDQQSLLAKIQHGIGADEITTDLISGFLNISFVPSSKMMAEEVSSYLLDENYLKLEGVSEDVVIVDYSGPNVAKRFSIGNLRSTVIGSAVSGAYKALGYHVEGWNHLGDWGTQFGKLIVAIKKWGNLEEINSNPIEKLTELYVEFHKRSKESPELEAEARQEFRKLELQDPEAVKIWQECVDWSLEEFNLYYKLLDINIENTVGESFYNDKTQAVIKELEEQGLLVESEGAKIVKFEDMPPAIIQKQDEATLYITRDLASIKYRIGKFNPKKIIYHVGLDQHLHFKQLFRIAELLGWTEQVELIYAGHGMVSLPSGKMSTREGNVVLLEDLIDESKSRVAEVFKDKTDKVIDDSKVESIATSSIKYSDLRQNRKTNVIFNWDQAVSLSGNSAPYLQYTLARINSVIDKSGISVEELVGATENVAIDKSYIKPLFYYKDCVRETAYLEMPNVLCNFIFELATTANSYYEKVRIIDEDRDQMIAKILPLFIYKKILEESFEILGIVALKSI